jgi:hypothetical protein
MHTVGTLDEAYAWLNRIAARIRAMPIVQRLVSQSWTSTGVAMDFWPLGHVGRGVAPCVLRLEVLPIESDYQVSLQLQYLSMPHYPAQTLRWDLEAELTANQREELCQRITSVLACHVQMLRIKDLLDQRAVGPLLHMGGQDVLVGSAQAGLVRLTFPALLPGRACRS